jgi:hypothetical protein
MVSPVALITGDLVTAERSLSMLIGFVDQAKSRHANEPDRCRTSERQIDDLLCATVQQGSRP